ncbi:hypothetical protein ABZ348_26495 [Streptomyces sp. NPDC005963]|uniref:effector-associated constant component EACC1 n=1 Tax=Streptomyces sp. NPDC005963 TaxID=3156721 RepID=UPI0033EE7818
MGQEIVLESPATDARAADSLRRWLIRDGAALRATHRAGGPVREGILADAVAVIAIVVSGVLALPAAIDSVRRWFATQPPATGPVTLRRGAVSIEISGSEDVETLVRYARLLENAEPDTGSGSTGDGSSQPSSAPGSAAQE